MKFNALFNPIEIGSMRVPNRFVVPPQGTNLANEDGTVSQTMITYYKERARGGFGLVTIEVTSVSPDGRAIVRQPALWSDEFIEGYGKLADAIHKHGAKMAVQIHHAGRQTYPAYIGNQQPVSSSPIPCPSCKVTPRELTTPEVYEMIDKFVQTAVRCKKAGVDAVEIHAAHGYLISQFMSTYSNRRTDEFGGSFDNRIRFPLLIVQGIRSELGNDYPLIFRISGDEKVPGGRTIIETIAICRAMEDAGVNAMHITAGSYGSLNWVIQPSDAPLGLLAEYCDEVKRSVSVPVIAVGRINDPYIADTLIATGRADMVAVGRQSIADAHFPNKILGGKLDEISPCIACNQGCLGEIFTGNEATCVVSPFAARAIESWPFKRVEKAKKVMVVGGGPGGLLCSWVLAMRGHDVSLLEKENEVGGQYLIASYPNGKGDLAKPIRYYRVMCKKHGVKIRLNTEVTEDLIRAEKPDVVVLATGGVPLIPEIKGIDTSKFVMANDVLMSKVPVGDKVLIAGGGLIGAETADFLGHYEKKVTVIEMKDTIASDVNMVVRVSLMQRLKEYDTVLMPNTEIVELFDDGAVIKQDGKESALRGFDTVVLALGTEAYNPLEDKVKGLVSEVYVIGDAKVAGKILKATETAAEVGTRV